MQILRVVLKNCGIHEHLDFSPGSVAVVGLLGKNGDGKSTVLKFIRYAFTGEMGEGVAQNTYIRNGAKRAEVWVYFRKNGQDGCIYRRITSTTATRELTWAGQEPITVAAKVDAAMEEILGADKKAISNAVFLPQGELGKILFGDRAEREVNFTRLVGVSHLEKAAGIIDGKIKALSGGLEDVSVLKDEVTAAVHTSEQQVRDMDLQLRELPDVEHYVTWLEKKAGLERTLADTTQAMQTSQGLQGNLRATIDTRLQAHGFTTMQELQAGLETLREQAKERDRALQAFRQRENLINSITYQRKLRSDYTAELARLTDAVTATEAAAINVEDLREAVKRHRNGLIYAEQVKRLEVRLANNRASLAAQVAKPKPTSQELAAGELAAQQALEALTRIAEKHTVLREARRSLQPGACKCPVCENAINEALISEARILELKHEEDALRIKHAAANGRLKEMRDKLALWTADLQKISSEGTTIERDLNANKASLAANPALDNIAEIEATIASADAARAKLPDLRQQLVSTKTNLAAAENQLRALETTENLAVFAAGVDKDGFAQAQAAYDAVVARGQALKKTADELAPSISQLDRLGGAVATYERTLDTAQKELTHMLENTRPPGIEETADAVGRYKSQHYRRAELIGSLKTAREGLDRHRKRLEDMLEREAANRSRRQLVNDLGMLRAACSRDGLPMAFVSYQFKRLAELTRLNLTTLGADFSVDTDPDDPIGFIFTRANDPEGHKMPQSKMSGGQRIKLSVAFLISVQQLLLPELGLLVLDEPSTHLDTESVESLKDLLLQMASTLGNAQHQVWIVDHHPALESALGACHRFRR